MLVADTNVLIELFQPTLNAEAVQAVWASDQDWHLPGLWIPEFRHILLKYLRAGAILPDQALAILADANAQFADRTVSVNSADCLALAHSHGCSSYDAEFVVLANQLNCPLLTFDRKLLQLFPEVALKPGS
jgi:predicted nucleic acid-binding protein